MVKQTADDHEFLDGSEEDEQLVKELFDDRSPFFLLPGQRVEERAGEHASDDQDAVNRVISSLYSGPRIQDVVNALSLASYQREQPHVAPNPRGISKIEHKYSLRIKNCGKGMADDGYKWRKYGQKFIKNSPNPRSYYKCTNRRCNAKKQVEKCSEEPDTYIITYEGLHLHFTFPFFSSNEAQNTPKKPRFPPTESQIPPTPPRRYQGLLQDVVPSMIMNPEDHGGEMVREDEDFGIPLSNSRSPSTSSSPGPPGSPSPPPSWSLN